MFSFEAQNLSVIIILIYTLLFNSVIILNFINSSSVNNSLINSFEFFKKFLKKDSKVFINVTTFYINSDINSKVEDIDIFNFLFNKK